MKIEEGKFYKTRDGRKMGPMLVHKGLYCWGEKDGERWCGDGAYFHGEWQHARQYLLGEKKHLVLL